MAKKTTTSAQTVTTTAGDFADRFMSAVRSHVAGRSADVQEKTLAAAASIATAVAKREDAEDFLKRAHLLNRDSAKKAARILSGARPYCEARVFDVYRSGDASVAVLAARLLKADGNASRKAVRFDERAHADQRYKDHSGAQLGTYAPQALAFAGMIADTPRGAPMKILDRAGLESLIPEL